MSNSELKYWLALRSVPGVGNIALRSLIDILGGAQEVFRAPFSLLTKIPGIGEQTAREILAFKGWAEVEKECLSAGKRGVSIITYKDDGFPRNLLNIYDCPSLLYVKGVLKDHLCVAVVGSRSASQYGRFVTERICRELALNGLVVVSGLARGIDTAAHRGALAVHGRTVAVLGCGLDYIYPPENARLYGAIAEAGALISEYGFGTPPHRFNFPARNRIISGLSLGVVVVEAGERSGSLITARLALEQGREVFAVPGTIDSPGSRGTNRLIRDGAKLVLSIEDILEELRPQLMGLGENISPAPDKSDKTRQETSGTSPSDRIDLSGGEERICLLLAGGSFHIDQIIKSTGLPADAVHSMLVKMELKDLVKRLPGNNYTLRNLSL